MKASLLDCGIGAPVLVTLASVVRWVCRSRTYTWANGVGVGVTRLSAPVMKATYRPFGLIVAAKADRSPAWPALFALTSVVVRFNRSRTQICGNWLASAAPKVTNRPS